MTLRIRNRDARALWLHTMGLAKQPTGKLDILQIIKDLGFVQLDTIQNVTRAHHHILWSRNQNYREPMLNSLLAEERQLFEHYTHDASVLPMEFFPMWQRQFKHLGEHTNRSGYYKNRLKGKDLDDLLARIEQEGPLSTSAFESKVKGNKAMWERPPHKTTLDLLWYSGVLATSHRENFRKYYDLAERVYPEKLRKKCIDDEAQLDWLCTQALSRLGFATPGEIQRFWGAVSAKEAKSWVEQNRQHWAEVEIQTASKQWYKAIAPLDIEQRLADVIKPSSRLRILNPFDPAIRDRNRLEKLFGFDYRIEIFVPAAKREWGYYVYPLLEKGRFVGRIELKVDKKKNTLQLINLWPEQNVKWSKARDQKLAQELTRLARLATIKSIDCEKLNQPESG
ncbi:MAG: crosslink repair DNA glycosylase YcaQ family protein [Pseudomonadota bacterium]